MMIAHRLHFLFVFFFVAAFFGRGHASPVAGALQRRVSAFGGLTVGLGNNVSESLSQLANALATGQDPIPYVQDIDHELETQVTINVQVAPGDKVDPQDDIIDLSVQIILEIVLGVGAIPVDIALIVAEPALDTAMSQWLLSMGSDITSAVGQAYPPDSYVHLLQLNLELTINVLGLVDAVAGLLGAL